MVARRGSRRLWCRSRRPGRREDDGRISRDRNPLDRFLGSSKGIESCGGKSMGGKDRSRVSGFVLALTSRRPLDQALVFKSRC